MTTNLRFTRTIDGEDDLECDSVVLTTLNVTGDSFMNNLYVSGITNIPGGVVDLTDINCNSIVVATTTSLNTLTVSGLSTLAGLLASSITASGVVTGGSIVSTGNINATGSVTASSGNIGGALVVGTNLTAGNFVTAGNLQSTSVTTGAVSSGAITASGVVTGTGLTTAGVMQSGSVSAGAVNATGTLTAPDTNIAGYMTSGGVSTVQIYTGTVNASGAASVSTLAVNSATASVSSSTGAAVVTGGLGVGGTINAGQSVNASTVNSLGKGFFQSTENSTSSNTGSIQASGGVGVAADIFANGHVTSINGDNANSASTGAVIVPNGGIGCGRDIWGGARVTANSTTNATNASNGAIATPGGISCTKDIYSDGKVRGASLQIGSLMVPYETGTWTPYLQTLKYDGANYVVTPWDSATVLYSDGHYSKIGNQVIITYDTQIGFNETNNTLGTGKRYFCMTGIPYVNNVSAASNMNADDQYPNGYVNSIPAPLVYTISLGANGILWENGHVYEMLVPPLYPGGDTFTCDGQTLVFEANMAQYAVGTFLTWEGIGTVANYDIVAPGTFAVRMTGSISYISN